MRIIEIIALANGAHRNQTGKFEAIPEGWAVIPSAMVCENFPFGEIEVEEVDGAMTVTKWVAGEIPETPAVEPEEPKETLADRVASLEEALGMILNGVTE